MFMDRVEKIALEREPDKIVILGDLLHTHERLHTIPLNKAYELIDRMRKIAPTVVLVGNHDYIGNQQYLNDHHWMNGMKEWDDVTIIDPLVHEYINDIHVVYSPYVPPGRFQDALKSNTEKDWKDADIIFAHQEFFGCKMGAIVSVEGDKWPKDYPQILSGHIHSNQTPQENVYYPGSALQHAFGESEKNVIPIITWDSPGVKYDLDEVNLALPRKRIIYKDVETMDEYDVPETEDKIKITVSGDYDGFKAFKKTKKYKELVKTGTRVVFKPKKVKKKDKEAALAAPIDESNFTTILSSLVNAQSDTYLYQAHELVVNNKKISPEEVFFI